MISELFNALVLTYIGTEYVVLDRSSWSRRSWVLVTLAVVVNIIDRLPGIGFQFKNIPIRVILAAIAYLCGLYLDCRRIQKNLTVAGFASRVGTCFLYILPIYPFMAVFISFGFFLVITVFDFLHLPEAWLNMPIYYGTLYGPFSLVYLRVKRKYAEEHQSLPTYR